MSCKCNSDHNRERSDLISKQVIDQLTAFVSYVEYTPNGRTLAQKAEEWYAPTNGRILEAWPGLSDCAEASGLLNLFWREIGAYYNSRLLMSVDNS